MTFAFEAFISGRVQGVLFRDFVEHHAALLGIVGTVENMLDGTVCVYAEGEKEKLETLVAHLKKGPRSARVDSVNVSWLQPKGGFDRFSIRY